MAQEEKENNVVVQPRRVISLLGAATETLFRLGLGDRLVGRSHECDYPRAVLSLPCISRPRLDVNGSSKEIDDTVRLRSAAGEPIYKLDDDVLSEIAPFDLLIAQDHCRVCAVTPSDINQSKVMACANVNQLVLKPSTLSDCLNNINEIAAVMGVPERGIKLRATLKSRMDQVRCLTKTKQVRRVALLEWCDPIMTCGYWIPELISIAGGTSLHSPPPGGSTPTISFQNLLNSKPDVVIFALCGFGLTRAAAEIKSSWKEEWISAMKKETKGQMYIVDGNYLVNRSGPRVVESCEAISEALHPEIQGHFGHFGTDLLMSFDDAIALANEGKHTGSEKVRPEPFEETSSMEPTPFYTSPTTQNSNGNTSDTNESPAECARMQLKCLETGDINTAFAFNSVANQARWCGPERFRAVLNSHDVFQRLLNEAAEVGTCEERGGVATVIVSLPAFDGKDRVNLIWTMVAEKEEEEVVWRTEKVGMET